VKHNFESLHELKLSSRRISWPESFKLLFVNSVNQTRPNAIIPGDLTDLESRKFPDYHFSCKG
jgi:hypothetical protein